MTQWAHATGLGGPVKTAIRSAEEDHRDQVSGAFQRTSQIGGGVGGGGSWCGAGEARAGVFNGQGMERGEEKGMASQHEGLGGVSFGFHIIERARSALQHAQLLSLCVLCVVAGVGACTGCVGAAKPAQVLHVREHMRGAFSGSVS